ncbi:MAG TPA: hypothetical protein VMP08_19020 [Anaerolineae bacterium]|nr:hypothetical protein [Anaerolineae bacterium]
MAVFVQLLANYAGLIYIALIIGAVFYIREILVARQDLQQSLYSLEREAASSRLWRSIMMLGVLGLIAAATFVLANVVEPQLKTDEGRVTPTAAFTLPTNTPTPTFQPTPTRTPRPPTPTPGTPTPTAVGAPTEGPTPTAVPLPAANCPDPNVQIVAPVTGQVFSDSIQVRGTAKAPNFAFYKLTLNGPATNGVTQTYGDVVRTPVDSGVLGAIDPVNLLSQPGVYVVGLVVVDNTGNELPHCTVSIVVQPQ